MKSIILKKKKPNNYYYIRRKKKLRIYHANSHVHTCWNLHVQSFSQTLLTGTLQLIGRRRRRSVGRSKTSTTPHSGTARERENISLEQYPSQKEGEEKGRCRKGYNEDKRDEVEDRRQVHEAYVRATLKTQKLFHPRERTEFT